MMSPPPDGALARVEELDEYGAEDDYDEADERDDDEILRDAV
jgi:hypothetical protein